MKCQIDLSRYLLWAVLLFMPSCSADLVVYEVSNPAIVKGIRVYAPATFKITKIIQTKKCEPKTEMSIIHLPLGEPYDISVKTGWLAKSEFAVVFNDNGTLKQVTLNSTPQTAENLKAAADFTRAIGEVIPKPLGFVKEDCGVITSEEITKIERIKNQ